MGDILAGGQFEAVWEWLGEFLKEHWWELLASAGALVFGWWWGRRQARRQWKAKEFLDRLNISLNTLVDGTLLIRTIFEGDLESVFHNDVAAGKVLAAAKKTTAADPILPVPKDHRWFLLNGVLNTLSQQFAEGTLRRDAGGDVRGVRYVICLTCEVAGAARTRKVRAMMIQADTLARFASEYADEMPTLETTWHETRVQTLRTLARRRQTEGDHFLEMEICV